MFLLLCFLKTIADDMMSLEDIGVEVTNHVATVLVGLTTQVCTVRTVYSWIV